MLPSNRQQAIYDEWQQGDANIVINAVAGSGKTTTLMELMGMSDGRVLFVSFNNSIEKEITDRIVSKELTRKGKAMTMHKLGLSAIRATKKFTINNGKNFDLIKLVQEEHEGLFKRMTWEDKLRLSYNLMDMNDTSRMFLTDDIDEIDKHLLAMAKYIDRSRELEILWQSLLKHREESYKGNKIVIDFNDMIYYPVKYDLHIPIVTKYLFIDEAQDLNLCQHKLLENLINQGVKKWVAVGDKNQSIYGFSGASTNSFGMFLERENVKEMQLDICYRCPTSVIDEANKVFDVMEYGKNDEGEVSVSDSIYDIKEGSMVICRNTKPLINLFFELLNMDKQAYLMGNDILSSVNRFMKPFSSRTVTEARQELMYKMRKMQEDTSKEGTQKAEWFAEDYTNFIRITSALGTPLMKISEVLIRFQDLFTPKPNSIVLCTIHKSKGLESDYVYLLNRKLIPNKFAFSDEQKLQEKNLLYVALTRAKIGLCYLDLN